MTEKDENVVKLWHDDIRTPPDETWTWARTNEAAKWILQSGRVVEISMDHDLGLHDLDPAVYESPDTLMGQSEQTGYDLVRWMCDTGHLPGTITIHSWNPPGAKRMRQRFHDFGVMATVRPFDASQRRLAPGQQSSNRVDADAKRPLKEPGPGEGDTNQ